MTKSTEPNDRDEFMRCLEALAEAPPAPLVIDPAPDALWFACPACAPRRRRAALDALATLDLRSARDLGAGPSARTVDYRTWRCSDCGAVGSIGDLRRAVERLPYGPVAA